MGQDFWKVNLKTVVFWTDLPLDLQGVSVLDCVIPAFGILCIISSLVSLAINIIQGKGERLNKIKEQSSILLIFAMEFLWSDFKLFK